MAESSLYLISISFQSFQQPLSSRIGGEQAVSAECQLAQLKHRFTSPQFYTYVKKFPSALELTLILKIILEESWIG